MPYIKATAIVRLQHIRAHCTSVLPQYKPQLLYIPQHYSTTAHTCNWHPAQTTIKAEPTACNKHYTSYLFVPRQRKLGKLATFAF